MPLHALIGGPRVRDCSLARAPLPLFASQTTIDRPQATMAASLAGLLLAQVFLSVYSIMNPESPNS